MQSLDYYKSFAVGNTRTVELTQEEECVVLKAHDYGVRGLEKDEIELIDRVMSKLKDQIWP